MRRVSETCGAVTKDLTFVSLDFWKERIKCGPKKIRKNSGLKVPNVGKRHKLIDSRSQVYPNRITQRNLRQDTSKYKTKGKEKIQRKKC